MAKKERATIQKKEVKKENRKSNPVDKKLDGPNRPST
ncbi:spore protein [Paraliobacillus quinghaiensis]|nr:spore protein [Paraliobacillus quinghaiensis]